MKQNLFDITNVKYLPELEQLLSMHNVSKEEVVIRGSGPLVLRGLREQGDLDIVCTKATKNLLIKNSPTEIDFNVTLYQRIGLSAKDIINDKKYYDNVQGWKFLRPEIVLSNKRFKNRKKDQMDKFLLEQYAYQNPEDWDWDLVRGESFISDDQEKNKLVFYINELINCLREDGLNQTLNKSKDFVYYRAKKIHKISSLSEKRRTYKTGDMFRQNYTTYIGIDEVLANQFSNGCFSRIDLLVKLTLTKNDILDEDVGGDINDVGIFEKFRNQHNLYKEWASSPNSKPVQINYQGEIVNEGGLLRSIIENKEYVPVEIVESRPEMNKIQRDDYDDAYKNKIISNIMSELKWRYGLYFYIIVWPAALKDFNIIQNIIEDEFDILTSKKVKHDDLYSFAKKMYLSHLHKSEIASKKADRLIDDQPDGENLGIFLVDIPNRDKNNNPANRLNEIKKEIRKTFKESFEYGDRKQIIHNTDTYRENRQLNELLSEHIQFF